MSSAQKLLMNQFRSMKEDPVWGIDVEYFDESNVLEWKVFLEGPVGTPYEGGTFQLKLVFPKDYPYSPPSLTFLSKFWHPNVYSDGKVCISILHPPVNDEMSGERPEERWLPTQSPETILLSVQSMLNEPNFSSPANVDASVMWKKNPKEFRNTVKKLVDLANDSIPSDFISAYKLVPEKIKLVEDHNGPISMEYDVADNEDLNNESDGISPSVMHPPQENQDTTQHKEVEIGNADAMEEDGGNEEEDEDFSRAQQKVKSNINKKKKKGKFKDPALEIENKNDELDAMEMAKKRLPPPDSTGLSPEPPAVVEIEQTAAVANDNNNLDTKRMPDSSASGVDVAYKKRIRKKRKCEIL